VGSSAVVVVDVDAAADDVVVVVPIEPVQAIRLNASRNAATAAIATRRRISRTLEACGDMPPEWGDWLGKG
jgi:hypothetical protein